MNRRTFLTRTALAPVAAAFGGLAAMLAERSRKDEGKWVRNVRVDLVTDDGHSIGHRDIEIVVARDFQRPDVWAVYVDGEITDRFTVCPNGSLVRYHIPESA